MRAVGLHGYQINSLIKQYIMKHLLFALLLISASASGQTGNYTHDVINPTGTSNQTYLMDVGIDTLSGSNDTLLVQFDRSFPGFYGITYTGVLAASSTSTTLKAELLGRNKSSESWVIIDDVNVTTEGSTTTLTADLNYMYLALRFVSTTGNAHINSTILLKKKSSSASAGGGASYLVYTALLTQTGTNAPVATVLDNTLGGTVVWSRDSQGIYVATLSGAFTANKTTPISQREQQSADNVDDIPKWLTGLRLTDNTYGLNTGNSDIGLSDSVLSGVFIEIRVYP